MRVVRVFARGRCKLLSLLWWGFTLVGSLIPVSSIVENPHAMQGHNKSTAHQQSLPPELFHLFFTLIPSKPASDSFIFLFTQPA